MHMGIATIAKVPELVMEQQEAHMLAEATANVARHYDLGATQKHLDWGNLISCLAMVYGSRAFAIRARLQKERASEEAVPVNHPIIVEG